MSDGRSKRRELIERGGGEGGSVSLVPFGG